MDDSFIVTVFVVFDQLYQSSWVSRIELFTCTVITVDNLICQTFLEGKFFGGLPH